MKTLSIIFIRTFFLVTLFASTSTALAQSESNTAKKEKLRAEIDRLNKEIASLQNSSAKNATCYSETKFENLGLMSDKGFESFCKNWLSKSSNVKQLSGTQVFASCTQKGNTVEGRFCIIENASPFLKEENEVEKTQKEMQETKEKKLRKVQNTIQYYQNLIDALEKELKRNGVEIVDASTDLAVKHVEQGGEILEEIKEAYIKEAAANGYTLIENKLANTINEGIDVVEKVLSHVPKGDKVTKHYLWTLFKSTPEVGKMVGNGAASITIYFRINEAKKHLEEARAREKELQQQ